jgi:hypothetical protein
LYTTLVAMMTTTTQKRAPRIPPHVPSGTEMGPLRHCAPQFPSSGHTVRFASSSTLFSAKKAARRGDLGVGQSTERRAERRQQLAPTEPSRAREIAPTHRTGLRRSFILTCHTSIPFWLYVVLNETAAAGISVMNGKKSDGNTDVLTLHRLLFHKLPPPAPAPSFSSTASTSTIIQ